MRITTLTLLGALGLGVSIMPANAAPSIPAAPPASALNIIQVAGGCGWGFHPYRGRCVRTRHYRPYSYSHRYNRPYGYHRSYPYYGGGYERWNRPSPSDHVANQLNAQQLGRGPWGY